MVGGGEPGAGGPLRGSLFFKRVSAEDNSAALASCSSEPESSAAVARVEGRDSANKQDGRDQAIRRVRTRNVVVLVSLNPPHITNILSMGKR